MSDVAANAEDEAEGREAEAEAESELDYPTGENDFLVGDGARYGAEFFAIPHNGFITLHPGPQGGYHLFVQVRVTDIDPSLVSCTRRLIDPVTGLVLREQTDIPTPLVEVADGVYGYPRGLLTYICPSIISDWRMNDYEFDLEVILENADGVWRSRGPVVPKCPIRGGADFTCLFDPERGCAPGE